MPDNYEEMLQDLDLCSVASGVVLLLLFIYLSNLLMTWQLF